MVPFLLRDHQSGAAVELIDDLENRLLPFVGGRFRHQQPSYPEMDLSPQCFRDQRIGGLLDAVVRKFVGAFKAFDQFLAHCRPQLRVHPLFRDL